MVIGLEGVVKLGRGFAELGIAGEEDVQKLLQMMIRVQAAADLARGGIEVYRAITKGVDAYRKSVLAAAAAEEVLAARRVVTAGAGTVAGAGVAGRAGTLRREFAGEFGGEVVGGVTGGYIGGRAAGRGILGRAGGLLRGLGLRGFGAGAALAYPFAVGLGGLTGGLVDEETGELTMRGRSAAFGTGWLNYLIGEQPGRQFRAMFETTRRGERQALARLERLQAFQEATGEYAIEMAALRQQQRELARGRGGGLEFERENVLQLLQQREQAEGRLAEARRRVDIATAVEAQAQLLEIQSALADAHERTAEAARERMTEEKAIAAERIRAAEESIRLTESEIDKRKTAIQQQREAMMTAAERFGQLSVIQQRQIL